MHSLFPPWAWLCPCARCACCARCARCACCARGAHDSHCHCPLPPHPAATPLWRGRAGRRGGRCSGWRRRGLSSRSAPRWHATRACRWPTWGVRGGGGLGGSQCFIGNDRCFLIYLLLSFCSCPSVFPPCRPLSGAEGLVVSPTTGRSTQPVAAGGWELDLLALF